jgi:hypothetical protein
LPKQSQGSVGRYIYIQLKRNRDGHALPAGLQALQLVQEAEEASLDLGFETQEALLMVAISQGRLPTEGDAIPI